MKRWKTLAAIMASVAVLGGVAAGCSDSDSSEATTPASATTAPNTAVQTDAEGNTQTEAPETETEPAPDTETEGGGEEVSGDATAGKATFEAACQGCHANGGQEAGVGPKLAAAALTADAVTTIITNGQGAMPGGLVSGDDLENVTAYVMSIQ